MAIQRDANLGLLFVTPTILFHIVAVSTALFFGISPHAVFRHVEIIPLATGVCFITGLAFVARSKGYSPLIGLLGFLGPIGMLLLILMPDRNPTVSHSG